MNSHEALVESVMEKKPISFEYSKPGKALGKRIGNVHAIFMYITTSGRKSIKAHVVQTAGVSENQDTLPGLRMFDVQYITNVTVLTENPSFTPFYEEYDPEWEGYKDVIVKVE